MLPNNPRAAFKSEMPKWEDVDLAVREIKQESKLTYLECARGVASVIVVFHHFTLAFLPKNTLPIWQHGIKYTPLYFFINGDGAVNFFFVLSGFVLT